MLAAKIIAKLEFLLHVFARFIHLNTRARTINTINFIYFMILVNFARILRFRISNFCRVFRGIKKNANTRRRMT